MTDNTVLFLGGMFNQSFLGIQYYLWLMFLLLFVGFVYIGNILLLLLDEVKTISRRVLVAPSQDRCFQRL